MRFSIERSVGRRMKHTYYGDVPFLEEDGVVGLDQGQHQTRQHTTRIAYRHCADRQEA